MLLRPSRRLALAVFIASSVVGTGCGSGDESGRETTAATTTPADASVPQGEWTGQVLDAPPPPDHPTLLATDSDQVAVAMAGDDGVIAGFATDGDGRFVAGEPFDTGLGYLAPGGLAPFADGWMALSSGGQSDDGQEHFFDVAAFRSTDGRTWASVDATGLEGPADVVGMAATDDGLIAAGARRGADDHREVGSPPSPGTAPTASAGRRSTSPPTAPPRDRSTPWPPSTTRCWPWAPSTAEG